jgi:hypothetical protein
MRNKFKRTVVIAPLAAAGLVIGMALPASAAPAVPAIQYGEVHSITTGGNADVYSDNGGVTWCFYSDCYSPVVSQKLPNQYGTVHSFTTGGNANVYSFDEGYVWYFDNNG